MNRRSLAAISLSLPAVALALFALLRVPAPEAPPPGPPGAPPTLPDPERLTELGPILADCHREHGGPLGVPVEATLVFTVAVDPRAPTRQARVARVRVKNPAESYAAEPNPFEACAERVLAPMALLAPGGRDSIDIPLTLALVENSGAE
jgi:hypothetical protein